MAATSVILFSLLTCFSGVVAWFSINKTIKNDGSQFKIEVVDTAVRAITFHEFQGTTSDNYYSFDPNPCGTVTINNGSADDDDYEGIALGRYSLEDPSHPLLMMFKVSGFGQKIELETDFTYLAQNKPESTKTDVGTYALLNAYDKSTLTNGDLIGVTADEGHGGGKTVYRYVSATSSYEMVWIDLKVNGNPMSSVVQFHSFEFTGANIDAIKGDKLINGVSTSGINIAESAFTNSNKSEFAKFSNVDTFTYDKKITAYQGDVSGITYVGIVIDYNSLALQYIFSKYLGSDALSSGEDITFSCDWVTKV